jgi:hypothetical protein
MQHNGNGIHRNVDGNGTFSLYFRNNQFNRSNDLFRRYTITNRKYNSSKWW